MHSKHLKRNSSSIVRIARSAEKPKKTQKRKIKCILTYIIGVEQYHKSVSALSNRVIAIPPAFLRPAKKDCERSTGSHPAYNPIIASAIGRRDQIS